ncbi:MAG: sugar phosphate nucleotidyltransferase [Nitrospiraceae bacterium]
MLPVGDKPLLEIIISHLRDSGIKRVNVSTHHQREKIESHFGDGREFGVDLSYVTEDRPLGTAGCLGLIEAPTETTLVINGDILTQVNFQAMLQFHRAQQADLTVAVRQYDVQVPFGVIESDGVMVRGVTEKPVFNFFVNAGIYLLEPSVYRLLAPGERTDMTDLIQQLLREGRRVASFPIREGWLDIGQPADYEQAQELIKEWQQDK